MTLRPDTIVCSCGENSGRIISLIANTPGLFGDTNSYYDHGAGRTFNNSKERDAWAEKGGWVNESDLPSHAIEDSDVKRANQLKNLRRVRNELQDVASLPREQQANAQKQILDNAGDTGLPKIDTGIVRKALKEAITECN